jgi:mannose-6-phosphate isomerase
VIAAPKQALRRLQDFLVEQALPLWAAEGFDEAEQCFHERLDFSRRPAKDAPRRLMVQARQIVVYTRTSGLGWSSHGQEMALKAFEGACRRYRATDGNPGWIFSVKPDGSPEDRTRDLYTHAFVLYMLACLYRTTGDTKLLSLADDTLRDIDQIFGGRSGPGFLSRVPGPTDMREQNPHMHLFEALLALAEFSGQERYLTGATALVKLLDQSLTDPASGTIRENFNERWVARPSDENRVEPGHQMEWAWLLREWERLTGSSTDERVSRLVRHTTTYGIDMNRGLVRNSVREDGTVVSDASRVWPQTESIRALCREDPAGTRWPGLVAVITEGLFRAHLPPDLKGGWIDQISEQGVSAVGFMPASTLYHLAGAAIDGGKLVGELEPPTAR